MRFVPLCLCLLVAAPPASAATLLVLDSMTDAFPANPCLPVSHQPIVFLGTACDGASCPPGTVVSSSCSGAQSTLQAAGPGMNPVVSIRQAGITGGWQARAWVDPAMAQLHFEDVGPSFVSLYLAYSTTPLDLAAMGAVALRISFQGTISPSAPLWCIVQLAANGLPGHPSARVETQITSTGDFVLPFSAFVPSGSFDFHGINVITLDFRDCKASNCTGSYPARPYSVGPISFVSDSPTDAVHRSWGSVKIAYR